ANWDTGVPNSVDAVASFGTLDITADTVINLGGNKTAGTIRFGDTTPSNNWSIAAGNTLTLDVTAGNPIIDVANASLIPLPAVNLSVDTLTRNTGAVVSFTLPTARGITPTTASIPNINGILGAWATIGAGATATWASNDGTGKIVGLTTFTDVTGTPTINSD